jgi:hypothetical protein
MGEGAYTPANATEGCTNEERLMSCVSGSGDACSTADDGDQGIYDDADNAAIMININIMLPVT